MSLDKFISGNRPKKKKKPVKTSPKPTSDSVVAKESNFIKESQESSQATQSEQDTNKNITKTTLDHGSPEEGQNTHQVTHSVDNRIFIEEFKDKSSFELFEIILDIVHSSPSYSRNKNLIAKYYLDNQKQYNLVFLSSQLNLTFNELYVYLAEIKNDFG